MRRTLRYPRQARVRIWVVPCFLLSPLLFLPSSSFSPPHPPPLSLPCVCSSDRTDRCARRTCCGACVNFFLSTSRLSLFLTLTHIASAPATAPTAVSPAPTAVPAAFAAVPAVPVSVNLYNLSLHVVSCCQTETSRRGLTQAPSVQQTHSRPATGGCSCTPGSRPPVCVCVCVCVCV